ncbi:thymidine phosphorylase [bacterium]|nr:thymidine phosphorylase [bacterium]
MLPVTIIANKRDGKKLSSTQIKFFMKSYLEGSVTDYQMSAMLMAIYLNGFDQEELSIWTSVMLHSGKLLSFSGIDGPVVDKHSTGGVGDKISIPLAPLLAELGFYVPMISGRGLGHTGGTLDKLESISGFNVNLPLDDFKRIVRDEHCSLIGQTGDIAPLDKRLYALRDVTATVASIPLIASSIMSKKLAEGIGRLLLDVKVGRGAFMKSIGPAEVLADTMIGLASEMQTAVNVFFTAMDEPLGYSVGNALEIEESLAVLRGEHIPQVTELVVGMAAKLLYSEGMVDSYHAGVKKAEEKLADGSAFERFLRISAAHGADISQLEHPDKLPKAPYSKPIRAEKSGYISEMNALSFGLGLIELDGGRKVQKDVIDPATGFVFAKKVGDYVERGELLYTIYYRTQEKLSRAFDIVANSIVIADKKSESPLILNIL